MNNIQLNPNQKSVLIVEDNEDYSNQIKDQLNLIGYQVYTATNGEVGWELMNKHKIDAILLDIVMPGKDGIWFLDQTKNHAQLKSTPIIVFTNLSHGEKVGHAIVRGIDKLLVKEDTSIAEVTQAVQEIILSHSK